MIVDDDPEMRNLLKDFFEVIGYEVLSLGDARDALSRIEAESFSVVITDYSMPDLDGIEFTRRAREMSPSLPIIGISATSNERNFIGAGADHFLSKPFDLKRLQSIVETRLKKRI